MLGALKSIGRAITGRRAPGNMVTIGRHPQTGEPIEVPEEDFIQQGMYDPVMGEIMMPPPQPKKPGIGSKIKRALPTIIDGALAGMSVPSSGSGGLDFFSAMSAGRNSGRQRDLMDYGMRRQQEEDRQRQRFQESQIMENEAQARHYLAQSQRTPREPLDPIEQKMRIAEAGGLKPGTPEFNRWWLTGKMEESETYPHLQTPAQAMIYTWQREKDPTKKKELQDKIFAEVNKDKPPSWHSSTPQWVVSDDGKTESSYVIWTNPQTQETINKETGLKRPRQTPAGRTMTPLQIENNRFNTQATKFLNDAGGDVNRALILAADAGADIRVRKLIEDRIRAEQSRNPKPQSAAKSPTSKPASNLFLDWKSGALK